MLTLNDEKSRRKLEESRKDFENIKNMSREDLEYAYYGSKLQYNDLKQALNEIREYCNNQKKAINPKNMNVGKLNLEIDDSTMAIYNTVNDILQIIDKYMKEDD